MCRPTFAIILVLAKLPNPRLTRLLIRICIKYTNIDVWFWYVLVSRVLKEDDSEDDSTNQQASDAEGESEDDKEVNEVGGCSQESVTARMQELSLVPQPTIAEEESASESDSDVPPLLAAPDSGDEFKSESESQLPVQDEAQPSCKEVSQATESSESDCDEAEGKTPQHAW